MLYQLHWQFNKKEPGKDLKTTYEMRTQFEIQDDWDNDKKRQFLNEQIEYVNENHPLPKGAIWMVCNEKSQHFIWAKNG